jgi:hypothetical protein
MAERRINQTWPFLRGDLFPHKTDLADLRNDYAGDEMQQAQGIVLRYLGNLPAEGTVDLESMAEDISRHYPFHGKSVAFFRKAVDALEKDGWVKILKGQVELHKIARVTRLYLVRVASRAAAR